MSNQAYLTLQGVEAIYGRSVVALRGVDLTVAKQSIVALLGPNGAGKTTVLRAISGMLPSESGRLKAGSVMLDGRRIDGLRPDEIVGAGLVQVPEGRRLFAELTIEENLRTGACQLPRAAIPGLLEEVYHWFPRLKERRRIAAGFLSGGEQQMVAIGRGLMANPKVLLLDEPSLGLAPQIVDQIFHVLPELRVSRKLTILLVEQNANKALQIADRGYIMEDGVIVLAGDRASLIGNDKVRQLYLGLSDSGERRSFRLAQSRPDNAA